MFLWHQITHITVPLGGKASFDAKHPTTAALQKTFPNLQALIFNGQDGNVDRKPVIDCIQAQELDLPRLNWLLKGIKEINSKDIFGKTLMDYARAEPSPKQEKLVECLIGAGAHVHPQYVSRIFIPLSGKRAFEEQFPSHAKLLELFPNLKTLGFTQENGEIDRLIQVTKPRKF